MYHCANRRIAYLAHPRTGSQATGWMLREQFDFAQTTRHHSGLDECPMATEGWRIATVVRDPYDALSSWYGLSDRGLPFGGRWMREVSDEWGTRLFPYVGEATDVFAYEDMEREWSQLLDASISLPNVNVSRRKPRWTPRLKRTASIYFEDV